MASTSTIHQNLFDSIVNKDYDTFCEIIESDPKIFYSKGTYWNGCYESRHSGSPISSPSIRSISDFMYRHIGLIPHKFIAKMIEVRAIQEGDIAIIEKAFRKHGYGYGSNTYGNFDMSQQEYQDNIFHTIQLLIDYFGVDILNSSCFTLNGVIDETKQTNMMESYLTSIYSFINKTEMFYQNMIIMMFEKGIDFPKIFVENGKEEEKNGSLHLIYTHGFTNVIDYLSVHHPEALAYISQKTKHDALYDFTQDVKYWKETSLDGVTLFDKYHPEAGDTLTKLTILTSS